jgi:hypothetical protein
LTGSGQLGEPTGGELDAPLVCVRLQKNEDWFSLSPRSQPPDSVDDMDTVHRAQKTLRGTQGKIEQAHIDLLTPPNASVTVPVAEVLWPLMVSLLRHSRRRCFQLARWTRKSTFQSRIGTHATSIIKELLGRKSMSTERFEVKRWHNTCFSFQGSVRGRVNQTRTPSPTVSP